MSWLSMRSHIHSRQQGTLVDKHPAGSSVFIFLLNRTVLSGSNRTGCWGIIVPLIDANRPPTTPVLLTEPQLTD